MAKNKWSNPAVSGRILRRLIKQMDTKMKNDPSLELAYIDRLLKAQNQLSYLIDIDMEKRLTEIEKKLGIY